MFDDVDPIRRPGTIWCSPPLKIGRHEWRIRQYEHAPGRVVLTYEWRPADPARTAPGMPVGYWYDMHRWPRYNADNGQTAGCPATLRKLYAAHAATLAANKAERIA